MVGYGKDDAADMYVVQVAEEVLRIAIDAVTPTDADVAVVAVVADGSNATNPSMDLYLADNDCFSNGI